MSDGLRGYLIVIGAVLMFVVVGLMNDADFAAAGLSKLPTRSVVEYTASVLIVGVASFSFVVAFLPSYFHWNSAKGLLAAVSASILLTAALIGIYFWVNSPLI